MLVDSLHTWLDHGFRRIGQILILSPEESGRESWSLCHHEDAESARSGGGGLEVQHGASLARAIALYNDEGEYRPLRSSPDLKRGWLLGVDGVAGIREALDHFYPAALGLWRSHLEERLTPVSFREKLQRQTGMYRSANRISDTRAQSLIRRVCHPESGCLKRILWEVSPGTPVASLPACKFPEVRNGEQEIPLLCQEACNILVAEARVEARNEVIVIKE
jgi:4Fe-4S iron-sulfur cluster binding domain/DR2241 stabilising domain